MPFVSRCIRILIGIVAVSQYPVVVATLCLLHAETAFAQASPASSNAVADEAVADEVATQPDEVATQPDETEPAPPDAKDPAAEQPAANCIQKVIDQHALTRKIREINNPLERIPDVEATKLLRGVNTSISNGSSGAADLENLTKILKHRIFQMTEPAFVADPVKVHGLFRDMDREINKAGNQAGNTQATKSYRQKYCDTVLNVSKQLLDNNLDARFFAIHVIKLLYVEKTQAGRYENHPESLAALISLMKDPDQPDSVKLTAAAAMFHVLSNMSVIPQQQAEVSDIVATELDRPCTELGYQAILLDSLFAVSIARRPVGPPNPTVMGTFVKLVDDRSRPLQIRCRAAAGMGLGAYDERINFDPLTYKIALLSLEASQFYNRSPGVKAWQDCGKDLFFAIRHQDRNGLTKKLPMLPQGIMNRAPTSVPVNDSGPLILKMAIPMMFNNAKIPQADQVELNNWIQANKALADKAWD